MMTTDISLNHQKGYWDFEWTAGGDISTNNSLDTQILMSILEEVRATQAEIPESNKRRGWIGNESTPNFQQGSKTWLFEQERVTGTTLNDLGPIVRNSLQWMIDDGVAKNVVVDQPFLRNGIVVVQISFSRDGSKVERGYYELWNNTGNF
jgi:phage gp46-like protein